MARAQDTKKQSESPWEDAHDAPDSKSMSEEGDQQPHGSAKPIATRVSPQRRQNRPRTLDTPELRDETTAIGAYKRSGSPRPLETGQLIRQEGFADEVIQENEKSDDSGLKLRLDLNLDIEVELKARIHGDLTLSLLK